MKRSATEGSLFSPMKPRGPPTTVSVEEPIIPDILGPYSNIALVSFTSSRPQRDIGGDLGLCIRLYIRQVIGVFMLWVAWPC